MTLGEFLRAKREARGMSLRALAKCVHYDVSALSRIETGALRPSAVVLTAYVRHLKFNQRESDEMFALAGQLPPDVSAMAVLQSGILEKLR